MLDRTRSMGDLGRSGENTERSGMRGRRDIGISGIKDICGRRSRKIRRRNCGIRNEKYKGNHEKNGYIWRKYERMGGKYEEIRGRRRKEIPTGRYKEMQRSAMIDRTRSMGDLGRSGRHTGRSGGNTGSSEQKTQGE
jgi:hypothetical protein